MHVYTAVLLLMAQASPVPPQINTQMTPQDKPSLTYLEQTKLENLQLKNLLLTNQQEALQKETQDFLEVVKRNHPGFQLIGQELVPIVTPKAPSSAPPQPKK